MGKIIVIDIKKEMVEKTNNLVKKYGYKNVEFKLGDIENLPIEYELIGNINIKCVINLATDKMKRYLIRNMEL